MPPQMSGEFRGNVMTFYDVGLSPPRSTSPWEYFPMQALEDPGSGFSIYDDFVCNNTTKTTDTWQVVKGTGGALALRSTAPSLCGWLNIPTAAAAANDYQCFFTQQPIFNLVSGGLLAFEAALQLTEAATNKASWFAGFTSVTTTGFLQNTGVPPTSYSGAVVYKTQNTLNINAQTSNGSTQNTTSNPAAAVSGQTFIVGGVLNSNDNTTGIFTYFISTVTGNSRSLLATGTLNLTLASLANMYFGFGVRTATTSAETLSLDWVQAAMGRYNQ
jgi:hypothetical protein